jgi:hypothetical protein
LTLTSSNPAVLRLSPRPEEFGTESITVQSDSRFNFWLQAVGDPGSANITATSAGYAPTTLAIYVDPLAAFWDHSSESTLNLSLIGTNWLGGRLRNATLEGRTNESGMQPLPGRSALLRLSATDPELVRILDDNPVTVPGEFPSMNFRFRVLGLRPGETSLELGYEGGNLLSPSSFLPPPLRTSAQLAAFSSVRDIVLGAGL